MARAASKIPEVRALYQAVDTDGYSVNTIDDIAEATGVSKATVMRYSQRYKWKRGPHKFVRKFAEFKIGEALAVDFETLGQEFNLDVQQALCKMLSDGVPPSVACRAVGLNSDFYDNETRRGTRLGLTIAAVRANFLAETITQAVIAAKEKGDVTSLMKLVTTSKEGSGDFVVENKPTNQVAVMVNWSRDEPVVEIEHNDVKLIDRG